MNTEQTQMVRLVAIKHFEHYQDYLPDDKLEAPLEEAKLLVSRGFCKLGEPELVSTSYNDYGAVNVYKDAYGNLHVGDSPPVLDGGLGTSGDSALPSNGLGDSGVGAGVSGVRTDGSGGVTIPSIEGALLDSSSTVTKQSP